MCDVTTYVTPTVGIVLLQYETTHNGSNIGSNITHIQIKQMMWEAINEEREERDNIASYQQYE